jgi:acetyl esterase/lipase
METTFLPTRTVNRWLLVSVAVLIAGLGGLLTACGGSVSTTVSSSTAGSAPTTVAAPSSTAQAPTTAAAVTTTTTPGPELQIIRDVRYMAERKGPVPPLLDVYAPKQAGPWPLVVMLHGGGLDKAWLGAWATKVAQRGAVVFVPEWLSDGRDPTTRTPAEFRASIAATIGDIAAAIRFARGTAARYGGDPEHLKLFGHSAGANNATAEAFSGASASAGGLEGAGSTVPESLVLFDGDILLGDQMWDGFLAADPGFMQLIAPWQYAGRRVDFPVTVIGSGDPNLSRPLGDPWAKDSWFVVRDPSGEFRRGLEKLGTLSGYVYLNENAQELFVERLRAAGNTVAYVKLTDSSHTMLGPDGMKSLVDAIVPSKQP